jgi:hypothetical protein
LTGLGSDHLGQGWSRRLGRRYAVTRNIVADFCKTFQRRSVHDPGRVAVDLAVLLADGGEAITDLAVLRRQPRLFGPVASDATAWRSWPASTCRPCPGCEPRRGEGTGVGATRPDPSDGAGLDGAGRRLPGFVLDLDATLVLGHSEEESAAPTWKKSFGVSPVAVFPRRQR